MDQEMSVFEQEGGKEKGRKRDDAELRKYLPSSLFTPNGELSLPLFTIIPKCV